VIQKVEKVFEFGGSKMPKSNLPAIAFTWEKVFGNPLSNGGKSFPLRPHLNRGSQSASELRLYDIVASALLSSI
jgi:hypothetical protein